MNNNIGIADLTTGEVATTRPEYSEKEQLKGIKRVLTSWVKVWHAGASIEELKERIVIESKNESLKNESIKLLENLAKKYANKKPTILESYPEHKTEVDKNVNKNNILREYLY